MDRGFYGRTYVHRRWCSSGHSFYSHAAGSQNESGGSPGSSWRRFGDGRRIPVCRVDPLRWFLCHLPGVNFTNVLRAAFTLKDPKSRKIQASRQYLIVLLGSSNVEAANKMLMKLTPD